MPISISIKTGSIDKTKLRVGKTGEHYLEIVLIETPNSKYGQDYMAVQSVTKEERDKGIKGAILGNAKILGQRRAPTPVPDVPAGEEPDVPF